MRIIKAKRKQAAEFSKKFGSKFRAGHFDYTIVWCEEISSEDGTPICGLCDSPERKIFIDVCRKDVQETLIHEMFHAECYESGMRQMQQYHIDIEELCCEVASRVVRNFELKRKNGKLRR